MQLDENDSHLVWGDAEWYDALEVGYFCINVWSELFYSVEEKYSVQNGNKILTQWKENKTMKKSAMSNLTLTLF